MLFRSGWHVEEVAAANDGSVDIKALDAAIERAKKETTKPSLIRLHTVIAWPAPKAQGTSKSHGSALGDEEIAATKVALGLNPDEKFAMPTELLAHARKVVDRGAKAHANWNADLAKWKSANAEKAVLLERLLLGKLPALNIPEIGRAHV